MSDDKLMQDAHDALDDMIQWVAAFAMGNGSHAVLMRSPRMKKAKAVREALASMKDSPPDQADEPK